MDLERVIAALAPRDVVGRAPLDVADLAYDTRALTPGALFFCVRGAKVDGHDLAPQAVEAGAAALVVERPLAAAHVPQIVVADSRAAMAVAADVFFGHPTHELEVVGVTGTNGKTTTAHLVYAILAAAGRRPGLLGTIEARLAGERRPVVRTTPEAIDLQRTFREMLDAGDRSCAMEASSHASELHRLDRVRFAALVFTNLTPDHLDFHGTMERYFEAKRRLFVEGDRPAAAINVGDPWGRKLAAERPDAVTFGLAEEAQIGPGAVDEIDLKLRGRFNVENALGAIAAARILGLDDAAVAQGLEAVRGVPGRFESVDEGQPFEVIVDYSHTPDSLENALHAARELATARVLGITGSMGKTGTKDILAALCRPSTRTVAAPASFNNELGLPLTLCRLEPDTEVCIVELAMRGFGQIAELCAIARPHIGVITNIGPVHLERVGDLAGVRRAQGGPLAPPPPGGTGVVPGG